MSDMNEEPKEEPKVEAEFVEARSASIPPAAKEEASNQESAQQEAPTVVRTHGEASVLPASAPTQGEPVIGTEAVVPVGTAGKPGVVLADAGVGKEVEIETARVNREAEIEMSRLSRRSFLWAGVAMLTGYAAWRAIDKSQEIDGVKAPFRRALEFDERVGRILFSQSRLAPTFDRSLARDPKPNGDYGLGTDLVPSEWSLMVEGLYGRSEAIELKMADILALPKVEMVTEHKCIEGWSTIVHWGGVRFVDFAKKYFPATIDGSGPDIEGKPDKLMPYVSLTTPDAEYYVGLDMASAVHPQTLLCYEMNGKPLTAEHGAPLRLVIPIKYGIKAIKRIGTISYTKERPEDYWAKLGYDWYAGH